VQPAGFGLSGQRVTMLACNPVGHFIASAFQESMPDDVMWGITDVPNDN